MLICVVCVYVSEKETAVCARALCACGATVSLSLYN
jgi:hypothetical protein